jgi:hypothetical protein
MTINKVSTHWASCDTQDSELNVVITLYSVATLALCSSGRSVVSTLTEKSVSDHLSLHVIILANEAGGESACRIYVSNFLSFSDTKPRS